MPINYSFNNGNAVLQTDPTQIQQFLGGFRGMEERGPAAPRPAPQGGRAVRSGPAGEKMRNVGAAEDAARIEEARARIAQARAISEPAPMRSIRGGPGMIGGVGKSGLQLDTSGMTGAQRQALLPQSASMGAIPASGASLGASTLNTQVAGRIDSPGAVNELGQQIGGGPAAAGIPGGGEDWYSLPDHVRKLLLIQSGFGSGAPVQRGR